MIKRKRTAAWLPRVTPSSGRRAANPRNIARRRQQLGLDERAATQIRDLFAREDLDAIGTLSRLYEHLLEFPEARLALAASGGMQRLRAAQARHRDALEHGAFDETYVRDRSKDGALHLEQGVKASWLLAAYARTLADLVQQAISALPPEAASEVLTSILKVAFFDIGLTLEGYSEAEREETVERSDLRGELCQAAIALTRALTGGDVLSEAARWGIRLIGADAACIAACELGGNDFAELRVAGLPDQEMSSLAFPADAQTAKVMSLPSRVVISGAGPGATDALSATAQRVGMESSIHVALVEGAAPAGVALFMFRDAKAPSADQLAMAGEYTRLVAAVLSSARRHEEAVDLASTDALTGLANRRFLSERMDLERRRARSFSDPFSVLALDLDHFKRINDSHGHGAGDQVLKEVAITLIEQLRDVDLAARVGGDELVVVLPNCSAEGANQAGERIRIAFGERVLVLPDGSEERITVSVGAATFPTSGSNLDALLSRADEALYAAKHAGRNCTRHYRDVLAARLVEDPAMVSQYLADDPRGALPLLSALELSAPAVMEHSIRVADHCAALAAELGIGDDQLEILAQSALLHDIGLVGIPPELLDDDNPDASADWEALAVHATIGSRLLEKAGALHVAAAGVRHHHERFDGSGYPAGLVGEDIPLEARVIAVADSFVSLTSSVPGREGLGGNDARDIIVAQSGKGFDPRIVDALVRVLARRDSRRPPRRGQWLEAIMDPTLIHDTIAPDAITGS